ncbi:MAG TPA: hypothetical protein VI911_00140 [Patescibacteria group bacterium]|nr:hypothetical protein [Patescibacteria group bacterium]
MEPEVKEIQIKKHEPGRAIKGDLIDMLIEEKKLLESKINAIDILLKH